MLFPSFSPLGGEASSVAWPARKVWDQGTDVNCCVSCALATCLEARYPTYPELSALFHFYVARVFGTEPGAMAFQSAFAAARKKGICKLSLYDVPMNLAGVLREPTVDAVADAATRRLGPDPHTGDPLRRVLPNTDRVRYWKRALQRGFPIMLGFFPDPSYWELRGGGATTWRASGSGDEQGHAVAVLGYHDSHKAFVVQDSRGRAFGKGGQWYLPYDVMDSQLIYAAYAIGMGPLDPW